jgi:hypothetical protein
MDAAREFAALGLRTSLLNLTPQVDLDYSAEWRTTNVIYAESNFGAWVCIQSPIWNMNLENNYRTQTQ